MEIAKVTLSRDGTLSVTIRKNDVTQYIIQIPASEYEKEEAERVHYGSEEAAGFQINEPKSGVEVDVEAKEGQPCSKELKDEEVKVND